MDTSKGKGQRKLKINIDGNKRFSLYKSYTDKIIKYHKDHNMGGGKRQPQPNNKRNVENKSHTKGGKLLR